MQPNKSRLRRRRNVRIRHRTGCSKQLSAVSADLGGRRRIRGPGRFGAAGPAAWRSSHDCGDIEISLRTNRAERSTVFQDTASRVRYKTVAQTLRGHVPCPGDGPTPTVSGFTSGCCRMAHQFSVGRVDQPNLHVRLGCATREWRAVVATSVVATSVRAMTTSEVA